MRHKCLDKYAFLLCCRFNESKQQNRKVEARRCSFVSVMAARRACRKAIGEAVLW